MLKPFKPRYFQTRQFHQSIPTFKKTGVVFMNMGGPSTVEETREFLLRLFSDRDIINIPFQKLAAKWIVNRRSPVVEKKYEEIGGGSPIRQWSEYQVTKVCEKLNSISPNTAPHIPYVAFRYAKPYSEETIPKMLKDGITQAIAFSQYPQFSYSTTGSSINELWRKTLELDPQRTIRWSIIDRWPTNEKFVQAITNHIKSKLLEFPINDQKDIIILFSAHSLPMERVNTGDAYPAEVAATVYKVMEKLGFSNQYRLVWQSQVGPKPWLGAKTDKTVQVLEQQEDYKGSLLVPIAFTSDHIETSHELDIELLEDVKRPELVKRSESMNGDELFIDGLTDIVKKHIDTNEPFSKQLELDYKLAGKKDGLFEKLSDLFNLKF